MRKTPTMLAALAAVALAVGCQRDDVATKEKLDTLISKVDQLEKKLDQIGAGGARGAAPGPRPGMPDPSAVYSVPVEGDPIKGPATAKVTIVEAAEFA